MEVLTEGLTEVGRFDGRSDEGPGGGLDGRPDGAARQSASAQESLTEDQSAALTDI